MPYVSSEAIQEARRVDLLTYLQSSEPDNLVRISGNNYCTREHDSLKISNGKWFWFSRGIGGVSALDYLIKVKGYTLPQAVEKIAGRSMVTEPSYYFAPKPEKKQLVMPELEKYPYRAIGYLKSRGIHPEVIEYCIAHSMLFETTQYHNAVFVGYDKDGIAKYAAMRGTRSKYKGEVTGSDKHFSFSIMENPSSDQLHVFESAIDLLSYASLEIMDGKPWKDEGLLSLAGVFMPKRENVVPVALTRFLGDFGTIATIHIHLDNDEVGRGATAGIMGGLKDRYQVLDEPSTTGKDINDQLVARCGLKKKREEVHER